MRGELTYIHVLIFDLLTSVSCDAASTRRRGCGDGVSRLQVVSVVTGYHGYG